MEVGLDDAMDESLLAQKSTNRQLQGLVDIKKGWKVASKVAGAVTKAGAKAVKAVGEVGKKVGKKVLKALGLREAKCL